MLDPVHNNSPDRYLTDIRFTSALSRNNPCQKIYICSGGRRDRTYRYTEPFQRCIIGNSRLRKPLLFLESENCFFCLFSEVSRDLGIKQSSVLERLLYRLDL